MYCCIHSFIYIYILLCTSTTHPTTTHQSPLSYTTLYYYNTIWAHPSPHVWCCGWWLCCWGWCCVCVCFVCVLCCACVCVLCGVCVRLLLEEIIYIINMIIGYNNIWSVEFLRSPVVPAGPIVPLYSHLFLSCCCRLLRRERSNNTDRL